ncbi:MAG: glycosyltransferase family 2 protein [Phycisphaerales bacterium]|nr:MAG: glycosyltransferase family 2 protein [Phycisphaerales bacterium]
MQLSIGQNLHSNADAGSTSRILSAAYGIGLRKPLPYYQGFCPPGVCSSRFQVFDMDDDVLSDVSTLTLDIVGGTFVVIPAYNEERSIEAVVREVAASFPNVVVVDDGSSDNTLQAARRAGAVALRHMINRGQGAALQTGMEYALLRGARFVVTFDADGQHRAEDIRRLLEPVHQGECHIALGSRFTGEAVDITAGRRALLRLAVLFTRIVSRVKLTDVHNGLRAFSREAAEKINLTQDRMAHASEMIDLIRQSGLPFCEVPVQIRYTEYSRAKGQSARGALKILIHYLSGRMMR